MQIRQKDNCDLKTLPKNTRGKLCQILNNSRTDMAKDTFFTTKEKQDKLEAINNHIDALDCFNLFKPKMRESATLSNFTKHNLV